MGFYSAICSNRYIFIAIVRAAITTKYPVSGEFLLLVSWAERPSSATYKHQLAVLPHSRVPDVFMSLCSTSFSSCLSWIQHAQSRHLIKFYPLHRWPEMIGMLNQPQCSLCTDLQNDLFFSPHRYTQKQ